MNTETLELVTWQIKRGKQIVGEIDGIGLVPGMFIEANIGNNIEVVKIKAVNVIQHIIEI